MLTAKSARRRCRKFLHGEAKKKNAGREARSAERPAYIETKLYGECQLDTCQQVTWHSGEFVSIT